MNKLFAINQNWLLMALWLVLNVLLVKKMFLKITCQRCHNGKSNTITPHRHYKKPVIIYAPKIFKKPFSGQKSLQKFHRTLKKVG